MSRIGKKPIQIPTGTEINISDGVIAVKGKFGELRRKLSKHVNIKVDADQVIVEPSSDMPQARMLWGTFASHIRNMLQGVNEPYAKTLLVEGVGYKVAMSGKNITLNVGYSHPVDVEIPEGLEVTVEKNAITIKGIDKEKVGQFAAEVRAVKKPEPYKGKGIRYSDEVIRRKEGKKAATA